MYTWDFTPAAREQFDAMPKEAQRALTDYMNAACLVDPLQFQRGPHEGSSSEHHMRTGLHFGPGGKGLVTFVVKVYDREAVIIDIIWAGDSP